MGLIDLPDDVLFDLTWYLSIEDVLSLKQTCRALHAFGSSDYLWRRMIQDVELPLDLPSGVRTSSLSHDELRSAAIKAMRLDANWSRRKPLLKRVKPLVRDGNGPFVDDVQFVPGGKWLLTVQRYLQIHWTTRIVLWSLEDLENAYRVAVIETTGSHRSSSLDVQDDGQSITVVTGLSGCQEILEVYAISLQDPDDFSYHITATPPLSRRIVLPPHPRDPEQTPVIHELTAVEDVIAGTALVNEHLSLQIFLASSESGYFRWVDPEITESISISWVKLYNGHLILLGMIGPSLVLRIYKLPNAVNGGLHAGSSGLLDQGCADLGPVIYQASQELKHETELQNISRVSSPSTSSISVLMIYTLRNQPTSIGQVMRFSLPFSPRTMSVACETKYFLLSSEVWVPLAQVGPTGRAVWLDHNWETERRSLLRYHPRCDLIGTLLPPDPALPFTPSGSHSMAFDEATGRMCLGMYNGDVYILDWVR